MTNLLKSDKGFVRKIENFSSKSTKENSAFVIYIHNEITKDFKTLLNINIMDEIVTGKRIKYEEVHLCTPSGDIEVNSLIDILTKKKNEIIEKYPETVNNRMQVTFSYDEDYEEYELGLGYIRYENDVEYQRRVQIEVDKKRAEIAELQRRIDANCEEAINYLKSKGAI